MGSEQLFHYIIINLTKYLDYFINKCQYHLHYILASLFHSFLFMKEVAYQYESTNVYSINMLILVF